VCYSGCLARMGVARAPPRIVEKTLAARAWLLFRAAKKTLVTVFIALYHTLDPLNGDLPDISFWTALALMRQAKTSC